jgi:hypothetical protein
VNIWILNSVPASVLPKNRSLRFTSRHSAAVMAALVVISCLAAAVRAQSPLDGFDPKANITVLSIVVQANGKILIGGSFSSLAPNGGVALGTSLQCGNRTAN